MNEKKLAVEEELAKRNREIAEVRDKLSQTEKKLDAERSLNAKHVEDKARLDRDLNRTKLSASEDREASERRLQDVVDRAQK